MKHFFELLVAVPNQNQLLFSPYPTKNTKIFITHTKTLKKILCNPKRGYWKFVAMEGVHFHIEQSEKWGMQTTTPPLHHYPFPSLQQQKVMTLINNRDADTILYYNINITTLFEGY